MIITPALQQRSKQFVTRVWKTIYDSMASAAAVVLAENFNLLEFRSSYLLCQFHRSLLIPLSLTGVLLGKIHIHYASDSPFCLRVVAISQF